MSITCTRCSNTGFLNIEQIPEEYVVLAESGDDFIKAIQSWIRTNREHDVQVCDCCGDGSFWHGIPGEHYNEDDREGRDGVYGYNGGLCECH